MIRTISSNSGAIRDFQRVRWAKSDGFILLFLISARCMITLLTAMRRGLKGCVFLFAYDLVLALERFFDVGISNAGLPGDKGAVGDDDA